MKQLIAFAVLLFLTADMTHAQDFVTRGKIEYEVKRNNKRMYDEEDRANSSYIASLPEYDVSYRELLFAWDRSVYQPGRKALNPSRFLSENEVYMDLEKKEAVSKRRMLDDYYVLADSIHAIKWKLENETRKIAGWQCRKAVGRIYDSVYVVAFYCPEIIPQGGPEMVAGLPGMILGLAIPRFYTTWFATRIEIANIDESKIVPPTVKKGKQYTRHELAEVLLKKYKEAGWWKDVTLEKVAADISDYLIY
ncbi:GLPGLI family protein [Paraflavitalea soli]|uniref:GLPGLI family protein n=1 Tax=Paraflavitalea soli TaxID=2315862 RepID=A0A3B7MKD8_9BACT|nr:GLPGLI family protein [Paraflavitalea soli]AXY74932.1 GLPGLI family protein [Paraflavitalea soli]